MSKLLNMSISNVNTVLRDTVDSSYFRITPLALSAMDEDQFFDQLVTSANKALDHITSRIINDPISLANMIKLSKLPSPKPKKPSPLFILRGFLIKQTIKDKCKQIKALNKLKLKGMTKGKARKIVINHFRAVISKLALLIIKNHGALYVNKNGNSKTGFVPDLSFTPIVMCLDHKFCRLICYARNSERMFLDTRVRWACNTWLMKYDLKSAEKQFKTWLKKHRPALFRLHVSGDFFSQAYVDMIARIASQFINTLFLGFTKSSDLDYTAMGSNVSIVHSIMGNTKDKDSLIALYKANDQAVAYADSSLPDNLENYTVCPSQVTNKAITCGTCDICWKLPTLKRTRTIFFSYH